MENVSIRGTLMAVTITKNFWNGTEYKSISKIVFTSPNFTSPAVAGTRSHMQPGGKYMGTWFEAVDLMYREKANQDYANFPTEMESFFGKLTLSGTFDLSNDTSALFTHPYGEDFDIVGPLTYPNILYKDRDVYAIIASCVSGTVTEGVYSSEVTFSSVTGSGIMNDWLLYNTSGTIDTEIEGNASEVGETTTVNISEQVMVYTNNSENTTLSGLVSGPITGTLSSEAGETVSGTLTGTISGLLLATEEDDGLGTRMSSTVSDSVSSIMIGHDYSTASGTLSTTFSGIVGDVGDTVTFVVNEGVTVITDDSRTITVSGVVSGETTGICEDAGTNFVSGTLTGAVSGDLQGVDTGKLVQSDVSGSISIPFFGTKNGIATGNGNCPITGIATGTISGTLDSEVVGSLESNSEIMCHQYSDIVVNSDTTIPRVRRHNGSNSIIFSVTFGEAYDCRLTAWDDDTHSTTTNKVLNEEHYKVDAVAYRSNIVDTSHTPTFRDVSALVYPSVYDIVLKGNERYYGDFDLIFAIDDGEYGEYLAFIPRLVNMDDSFTAGSYDFVTTLHYQYT